MRAGDKTFERDARGRAASSTKGGQKTEHVFDGRRVIREVAEGGEDVDYARGLAGRLISRSQGASSSPSYYHHDAIGSVVGLSDSSGASTDTYSYDAFGNELSKTGTTEQPYGYAGNRYDPTTKLSDFRARTYDPKSGRFTSKDPVRGFKTRPQSLNPYSYGVNGPLAHPDPSGLYPLGLDDSETLTGAEDDYYLSEEEGTASEEDDAPPEEEAAPEPGVSDPANEPLPLANEEGPPEVSEESGEGFSPAYLAGAAVPAAADPVPGDEAALLLGAAFLAPSTSRMRRCQAPTPPTTRRRVARKISF